MYSVHIILDYAINSAFTRFMIWITFYISHIITWFSLGGTMGRVLSVFLICMGLFGVGLLGIIFLSFRLADRLAIQTQWCYQYSISDIDIEY